MISFTGWQYMLIDLANHWGNDKLLFEERIKWAEDNLHQLEALADQAETKPLYLKAVMAIRKVQAGEPTGHLVGMDACCSGIQVMSALTGCITGATNTGLVDPNVRADAYTKLTEMMVTELQCSMDHIPRKLAKEALMTVMYGSKAKPKEIFGEDSPELNAFYVAAQRVAPGAWDLLQDLLGSWQPFALKHVWKLPDGFDAVVKVMEAKSARIEVDELDHTTFTYEFYVNEGTKNGLSLVANVVHSVDAYILRGVHRRCNYDRNMVLEALHAITQELEFRMGCIDMGYVSDGCTDKLNYYIQQWERSGMADAVILPHVVGQTVFMPAELLGKLQSICKSMLVHQPFPVVTVHDEFKCGANHMSYLRQHYINIFAELAESNLMSDLLTQIHGTSCNYKKLSSNLGMLIRGSNYALS